MTIIEQGYSLPEISKDSIILDDEMSAAFEEWFKLFYKTSAHLRKSQLPKIYVVANPEANAGTGAGGQYVFFSGLLIYCEDVSELLGVIAHEISHTIGGHPIQGELADQKSMASAVLTIIAGGLAAAAGKDMSVLIAGLSGGVQAYAGNKMRHSIMNEFAADAEALKILKQADIPRSGLLTFLKKLQKIFGTAEADAYFRTHPLTSERLERIADDVKRSPDAPWGHHEVEQRKFERIKAKVLGFTLSPQKVLSLFTKDTPSHKLARAIALARIGKIDESINLLKSVSANEQRLLVTLKKQLA
jgi:predicted Zn-dependent protease